MTIHLPHEGGSMHFPFHQGNNLPFMLLNDHPSLLPLSKKDVNVLCDIPHFLASVAEQTNQNITSAQKELLLWHWIFAHANLTWIQYLFRETKDERPPLLKSKHKLTGEMTRRLLKCTAC